MSTSRRDRLRPPLAVVSGVRTPFAKAYSGFAEVSAAELGRVALEEAIERAGLAPGDVDETVFGNVAGPADSANVSRVIALQAGIPHDRPAHTVNRNCASGMESVFSAWQIIREGRAATVAAGGTESMSQVPMLWSREAQLWLLELRKASLAKRLKLLAQLRPRLFRPVVGLELGLTDPVCGLNMGQTAEILAKEFGISRDDQDAFALRSHQRATAAWDRCFYGDEVTAVDAGGTEPVSKDIGPRPQQTLEALGRLRPIFDRNEGTITAGNSCPITDGAAALILMSADQARARGLEPLGYIRDYAIAGCDPKRMGLGPVFATHKLLQSTGLSITDFDLFEINEAFAAQVLACLKAFASETFAAQQLQASSAIGFIDPDRLNINGGAIALGHPVGVSGTRLILTLLRALAARGLQRGLATLCVGGGQGAAVWVERTLEDQT
ncbi:3-ketoacyl-CoA thiolase [Maioricimonas rarisocia]|uniref:3-ketoacyl-CoA thiolase n=1 Tax=Maioricimonas rarisocia TaxID=2528026 RepID=A0A517ZAJ1_9PLAN|nr:thiolase family protein [Maioricimonas rarisocia]QDU39513.1 3-ketoacyl-CoA thiolase [Maioricimonas rarisocia]